MNDFTDEQKRWLEGFTSGLSVRKTAPSAESASASTGPDALQLLAQDRTVAAGGKLVTEEVAKRTRHPLDRWNEVVARAEAGQFPKGVDVFLAKYHGLFYVAPAQDSFMCRLRMPNGILNAWQMRGLADAAERLGGGYADVTTRANLQIREIAARHAVEMLLAVQELGLTSRGSGADNIRNITATPTSGFDPRELIDVRPFAHALHHMLGRAIAHDGQRRVHRNHTPNEESDRQQPQVGQDDDGEPSARRLQGGQTKAQGFSVC